jgi:hypothetical protein
VNLIGCRGEDGCIIAKTVGHFIIFVDSSRFGGEKVLPKVRV